MQLGHTARIVTNCRFNTSDPRIHFVNFVDCCVFQISFFLQVVLFIFVHRNPELLIKWVFIFVLGLSFSAFL